MSNASRNSESREERLERALQGDVEGATGAPLPRDKGGAAAALRGLRWGLRSGGPVPNIKLPDRAPEYKKYCRQNVSTSSSSSGAGDSGGEVAAVDLHIHGRLPAPRDAVDGGWCSTRESPAGAALPGGGVPEHQGPATVGRSQDKREMAADGAATRQQDAPQRLSGDRAVPTTVDR